MRNTKFYQGFSSNIENLWSTASKSEIVILICLAWKWLTRISIFMATSLGGSYWLYSLLKSWFVFSTSSYSHLKVQKFQPFTWSYLFCTSSIKSFISDFIDCYKIDRKIEFWGWLEYKIESCDKFLHLAAPYFQYFKVSQPFSCELEGRFQLGIWALAIKKNPRYCSPLTQGPFAFARFQVLSQIKWVWRQEERGERL